MHDLKIKFLETHQQWCVIYTAPAGVSHDFFQTAKAAVEFVLKFYVPVWQKMALDHAGNGMIEQANFYLLLANEATAKYQGVHA